MASWSDLTQAAPEIAQAGRRLIYRTEVGKALLATVRGDGVPRIHPVYVAITDDHLYVFVHRSAMRADLESDGRYALHAHQDQSAPSEFTVRGRARVVGPGPERDAAAAAWYFEIDDETTLFELMIETVLLGERPDADAWPPVYSSWRPEAAATFGR
jgi:pyridoxamine 5'-phosphate oxidase-like protein